MAQWITGVVETLGYFGIAILMFAENVFPPIPSEVIMPLAGFTAASGSLNFVGAVLAGATGSLLGALAWYYAGRLLGGERIKRFAEGRGRWLGLSGRDIETSMAWFARHGRTAVLIGRLVPGVRTLISIPAGLCGMRPLPFLAYSALGTMLWTLLLAAAGYLLEARWNLVADYLGPAGSVVVLLLLAALASRILRRRRRSDAPE